MGRAGGQRSALFGRGRELAVLARAIEDAATGRLQVVTVGGPAGIGKSRLAAEALARAAAAGFEPLSAAAGPLDRDLSYAPVVQALRPLLDSSTARRRQLTDGLSDLGRLFDGLDLPAAPALGGPGLERTRLFEAVRRMLERAADRAPLALLLDDVQWADPASQALLGYLARGLTRCRLLLLLTYRTEEDAGTSGGAADLLAALHRAGSASGGVTDLVLEGLDAAETLALLAGTSRRSSAPARALAALAALARQRPALSAAVETGAPLRDVLAVDADFAEGFAAYLRDYGCRGLRYEAAEPNLDEQPELVLALVRVQLVTGYDPADADRALAATREEAQAEARRRLAGRPADLERFEQALADAVAAYPVREDNVFFTMNAPMALVRRVALEIGHRLAARGLLDEPDHVFDLTSAELRDGLVGTGAGVRDLARRRLGERAWILAHPGPSSYGTPPAPPSLAGLPGPARHTMEAFLWSSERVFGTASIEAGGVRSDGVLVGAPASAGRCTGTVRVIHGEDEFRRIRPGDVLVCPITSPVWSVIFPSISALVTDTGGVLSHPAIIAREYGIPAVVATREGTARLHDGQVVLVDGTAGTVTPIDGARS